VFKLIAASLMVVSVSVTAFAGKRERDLMTKEVVPAVEEAQTTFQKSCGCPLVITVDEGTITSMDEIRSAKHMATDITEHVPKYCTDGASKKALCQMKTLTFTKAAEAVFTIKDGKGIATTTGQQRTSWEMMIAKLDK
jgi:hypothetical protein